MWWCHADILPSAQANGELRVGEKDMTDVEQGLIQDELEETMDATGEEPPWGELPSAERQLELEKCLQAWDTLSPDEHTKRLAEQLGPFASTFLSGADVFYLAVGDRKSVVKGK